MLERIRADSVEFVLKDLEMAMINGRCVARSSLVHHLCLDAPPQTIQPYNNFGMYNGFVN